MAISGHILDELEEVLRRKFNWPDADIREMRRQFRMFAQYVDDPDAVDVITADPDDNRVLEAAARSDYIVSGDHHLLDLGHFRNIPIVRVAEFIEIFDRQPRRIRIAVSSTRLLDGAGLERADSARASANVISGGTAR